ncbi:MAG: CRISPR-associated CARF protein Csa3 [Candidatus Burarchaeum sp.]|nr:CRISPR-associated CARF protein Csa3 [Candidatus Burarchaeum sp.]MDO8339479.1 CRISPR-associated CARF protein Csa3 [Candidatus Burarchaeum sp.]
MAGTTLISTFYNVAPQTLCIMEFKPSKLILLRQAGRADKQLEANEKVLKDTYGKMIDIERAEVMDPYDVQEVAEKTVKLIEREHKAGSKVILNVTGGRRTQMLGALFAAYARAGMVDRIVYAVDEQNRLVELPKLDLSPSKKKREVLQMLAKGGHASMSALAKKLGRTRGMLYVHLRELKEAGYLDEKYGLTTAGRLALL